MPVSAARIDFYTDETRNWILNAEIKMASRKHSTRKTSNERRLMRTQIEVDRNPRQSSPPGDHAIVKNSTPCERTLGTVHRRYPARRTLEEDECGVSHRGNSHAEARTQDHGRSATVPSKMACRPNKVSREYRPYGHSVMWGPLVCSRIPIEILSHIEIGLFRHMARRQAHVASSLPCCCILLL